MPCCLFASQAESERREEEQRQALVAREKQEKDQILMRYGMYGTYPVTSFYLRCALPLKTDRPGWYFSQSG